MAFPFRFARGRAVRVDDQSEAYAAQKIASIAQTRRGELPLTPTFGTEAPEFKGFDSAGLLLSASTFFPDLQIGTIRQSVSENGQLSVTVEFTEA